MSVNQPSTTILAYFGVQLNAGLGGRVNQHWSVRRGDEVLVLRQWGQPIEQADYEARLLNKVAALGWPVARMAAGPIEVEGTVWSLSPTLLGEPMRRDRTPTDQFQIGRLLAELHADLATIVDVGQRHGWRRAEAVFADHRLDDVLNQYESTRSEAVRILRWHLTQARRRVARIDLLKQPGQIIHGDFTPWNLLFSDGKLSGILDFELAHWDHRVAEFGLAWRGHYDGVIRGYAEVIPLRDEEWQMITPIWWAMLIDAGCRYLTEGVIDDGWVTKMLLRRSELMGPDTAPYSG